MPLVGLTGVFPHPKRLKPKVPSKDAVWYQRVLCPLIETPRKQPSFRKSPNTLYEVLFLGRNPLAFPAVLPYSTDMRHRASPPNA